MPELIAVTGARGWVGREVCLWLRAHGRAVRPLTRLGELPDGLGLDLTAAENDPRWRQALYGCSAVIHCAAHVHRTIETQNEKELFELVNVTGTRKLLAAAVQARVNRFVLVSFSAVYDWSKEGPMKEDAALRPATAYAKSKCDAESLVRSSGLDWRIVRLATVYGKGDTANFQRLARALRARRFLIPGRGDSRKSGLPIDKAGELLGRLALCGVEASNTVVNLASPSAPTLDEICAAFSQVCGFSHARHLPLPLLKTAAQVGDIAQRMRLPFPVTSGTLLKLLTSTVLDVSKMNALFPDMKWPEFAESLKLDSEYYRNC